MKNKLITFLTYLLQKLNPPRKIQFTKLTNEQIAILCQGIMDEVVEKFKLSSDESDKLFIAGGSIRSLILGEEVKDYDIFLTDDTLIEKLRTAGIGFVSDNAVSFYVYGKQVQIVTTVTGGPIDIINQFDFVMNQNYYYPNAFIDQEALYIKDIDTILAKKLTINPDCRNKLGTLARISKFVDRGYTIPSKTDLLGLGIALTKLPEVSTLTQLKDSSKIYLSSDDCYSLMDNKYIEMATYDEVVGLTGNRGSGL